MKKIESEYEIDKQKRKQRLVRNEFLYNGESVGVYDMPLIIKQDIDKKYNFFAMRTQETASAKTADGN